MMTCLSKCGNLFIFVLPMLPVFGINLLLTQGTKGIRIVI